MPKRIKLKNKKISLSKSLFKLVMVAFVTCCLVLSITWTLDSKEKEKELVAIQTKIDAYKISNEEMQRNLDSDDLSDYMERIALEERGYAYPNERRFYDISRD